MSPRGSRSPKIQQCSPPRSINYGIVKNGKFQSLLRRTKKVFDLRSAFEHRSKKRVKKVINMFDLRGAFNLLTSNNSQQPIFRTRPSKYSMGPGSRSSTVKSYTPSHEKLRLSMTIDLEFLFCVNSVLVDTKVHPLRPLYSRHPNRGIDQIARLIRLNGLTINEAITERTFDPNQWNVSPNVAAEVFSDPQECADFLISIDKAKEQSLGNWEMTGAVLSSRFLLAPEYDSRSQRTNKSLLEIQQYLESLTTPASSNPPFLLLTRPGVTRLNISIGFALDDKPLDEYLDLLKHLALFLVEYNDIFSLLYPRFTSTPVNVHKNRNGVSSSHVCGQLSMDKILAIEAEIFGCVDIRTLSSLMDSKYDGDTYMKLVNWSTLLKENTETDQACMLTFSQPSSSQELPDISIHIRFIVSLIRFAERLSLSPMVPLYPHENGVNVQALSKGSQSRALGLQGRRIEEFLDQLGLKRGDNKYWRNRLPENMEAISAPSDFEECPTCSTIPGPPIQQPLLHNSHIQQQPQAEIGGLLTTSTEGVIPSSPVTYFDIDSLIASHNDLGNELVQFIASQKSNLVPLAIELAHDYLALEAQIQELETYLSTLDPQDPHAVEIRAILLDDSQLYREIRRGLEDVAEEVENPDSEASRLATELGQLKTQHARIGAVIEEIKARVEAISDLTKLDKKRFDGDFEATKNAGRGPYMRTLVQDIAIRLEEVRDTRDSVELALREDRIRLSKLESQEEERRLWTADQKSLSREVENAQRLRHLAKEVHDRLVVVFESGGPIRKGYPTFGDDDSVDRESPGKEVTTMHRGQDGDEVAPSQKDISRAMKYLDKNWL